MPRPGESPNDIQIGLRNNQIMQRYLVRRIHREVEFAIKESDGTETVGFITGFDAECLQISTTPRHDADEPRSELIFWPILKISETGRRLDSLEHEHRSKIRSYSHALRAQCEAYLSGKVNTARPRPQLIAENGQAPVFSAT